MSTSVRSASDYLLNPLSAGAAEAQGIPDNQPVDDFTVYVVGLHGQQLCDIEALCRANHYATVSYDSLDAFLRQAPSYEGMPACLVIDGGAVDTASMPAKRWLEKGSDGFATIMVSRTSMEAIECGRLLAVVSRCSFDDTALTLALKRAYRRASAVRRGVHLASRWRALSFAQQAQLRDCLWQDHPGRLAQLLGITSNDVFLLRRVVEESAGDPTERCWTRPQERHRRLGRSALVAASLADHFSRHARVIRLDDQEHAAMTSALAPAQSELDLQRRLAELGAGLLGSLRVSNRNLLREYQLNPECDLLVVHNLPIDAPLRSTPCSGENPAIGDYGLSAVVLAGLLGAIDEHPISYVDAGNGRLFAHHGFRREGARRRGVVTADLSSWCTSFPWRELAPMHAGGARAPAPATRAILCMRADLSNAPKSLLRVVPARTLYDALTAPARQALSKECFRNAEPRVPPLQLDVFERQDDEVRMRFGAGLVATDPEGAESLQELIELISEQEGLPLPLLPGTAVLMRNHRYLVAAADLGQVQDGVDPWLLCCHGIPRDQLRPVHPEISFLAW